MNAFQKLISEPTRARDYGPPPLLFSDELDIAIVCDGDRALIDSKTHTLPDSPGFYVNTETGKFCG